MPKDVVPLVRKLLSLMVLGVALVGCSRLENPGNVTAADKATRAQQGMDGNNMVSFNAADAPAVPAPPPAASRADKPWPAAQLEAGRAWISCDTDYAGEQGDGVELPGLDRAAIEQALAPCVERGLLRVRYVGKINPGFSELVWRIAAVADARDIDRRILDLDSSGGQVEAAIVAGDQIGESGWTIWVREGSLCHSACVFVLAAGDNRLISGKVGIHRMMRISSKATSRAELNAELQQVYDSVKDYLQRNGVAVGVADLMMTVPNRSLRLLTSEELKQYGLDGTNAVQDDLERIRQMRKCGDDFVRRKDAFLVAFDQQCRREGAGLEDVTRCGQELKQQYGFPDEQCPAESPLAEIDRVGLESLHPAVEATLSENGQAQPADEAAADHAASADAPGEAGQEH